MADDLDKYLSELGIDTDDEAGEARAPALPEPDLDMETALAEDDAAEEDFGPAQRLVAPTVDLSSESYLERCETFLVNLLLYLDPGYAVEVREVEGGVQADVYGGEPGKIIGRGGRTLAALEYLTSAVINRDDSLPHVRVSIDVGGYKERRDERLRGVALKAAARARKTGFAVELEPMSAAERRVIHMTLADEPEVESESSGEGRNRRVVVKPL
jgi:spoIIIJ-associated protein